MAWDTCSSTVLAREKPEFNSVDPSRRPHLVLALLLQERLPKDREIKGAWG